MRNLMRQILDPVAKPLCDWCAAEIEGEPTLHSLGLSGFYCNPEHEQLARDNIDLYLRYGDDMDYAPGRIVSCLPDYCGWVGELRECRQEEVNSPMSAWRSLGGREGHQYHCPNCGMIVYSHYTRMS